LRYVHVLFIYSNRSVIDFSLYPSLQRFTVAMGDAGNFCAGESQKFRGSRWPQNPPPKCYKCRRSTSARLCP